MTDLHGLPGAHGAGTRERPDCRQPELRRLIERHFTLSIRPADERRMREHLPACASCRAYYEQHLLLAQIDPEAPGPAERLRVGLGLRAPKLWLPLRVLGGGAALAAAAALLLLLLPRGERATPVARLEAERTGEAFVARGTATDALAALAVFEIDAQDNPRSLDPGASIPASAELSFAYRNRSDNRYLMVFGVDAVGEVRWYFPAWTNPAEPPSAIAIDAAPTPRELAEAVRHPLPPGPLVLYGLFLPAPRDVREVERAIATAPDRALDRATLSLEPGAVLWSRRLTVLP